MTTGRISRAAPHVPSGLYLLGKMALKGTEARFAHERMRVDTERAQCNLAGELPLPHGPSLPREAEVCHLPAPPIRSTFICARWRSVRESKVLAQPLPLLPAGGWDIGGCGIGPPSRIRTGQSATLVFAKLQYFSPQLLASLSVTCWIELWGCRKGRRAPLDKIEQRKLTERLAR